MSIISHWLFCQACGTLRSDTLCSWSWMEPKSLITMRSSFMTFMTFPTLQAPRSSTSAMPPTTKRSFLRSCGSGEGLTSPSCTVSTTGFPSEVWNNSYLTVYVYPFSEVILAGNQEPYCSSLLLNTSTLSPSLNFMMPVQYNSAFLVTDWTIKSDNEYEQSFSQKSSVITSVSRKIPF